MDAFRCKICCEASDAGFCAEHRYKVNIVHYWLWGKLILHDLSVFNTTMRIPVLYRQRETEMSCALNVLSARTQSYCLVLHAESGGGSWMFTRLGDRFYIDTLNEHLVVPATEDNITHIDETLHGCYTDYSEYADEQQID